jgi:hypothetical protein
MRVETRRLANLMIDEAGEVVRSFVEDFYNQSLPQQKSILSSGENQSK